MIRKLNPVQQKWSKITQDIVDTCLKYLGLLHADMSFNTSLPAYLYKSADITIQESNKDKDSVFYADRIRTWI